MARMKLGSSGLEVSKQGLGCMGMSVFCWLPKPEPEMIELIHHAINSGITFIDTSDFYGPLWDRFFSNTDPKHYNIYIHVDPLSKIGPIRDVFRGRLIPAKRTQRSSATLTFSARRLLATAMLDDPANTYFALTSQHCIPLRSFDYLHNFLFDLSRLSPDLEKLS